MLALSEATQRAGRFSFTLEHREGIETAFVAQIWVHQDGSDTPSRAHLTTSMPTGDGAMDPLQASVALDLKELGELLNELLPGWSPVVSSADRLDWVNQWITRSDLRIVCDWPKVPYRINGERLLAELTEMLSEALDLL